MTYQNLDQTEAYSELIKDSEKLRKKSTKLSAQKINQDKIKLEEFTYSYAGMLTNSTTIKRLEKLVKEQRVLAQFNGLLEGQLINISENRSVGHHHLRNFKSNSVFKTEFDRIKAFSDQIRSHSFRGKTKQPIKKVVQVGIGGSELGPRSLIEALSGLNIDRSKDIEALFLSNIDTVVNNQILNQLDLDETLFIFTSKSGNTLETKLNMDFIYDYAIAKGKNTNYFNYHAVSVTSPKTELDNKNIFYDCFYLDHTIGGRFSATSAVGLLILSIVYGHNVCEQLCSGAHFMDEVSQEKELLKNPALLDATLKVWQQSILGLSDTVFVPYRETLKCFINYLQQLLCESNGKRVNIYGETINYPTEGLVLGGTGCNIQHSYFQLLHQGNLNQSIQFILTKELFPGETTRQQVDMLSILNKNAIAQALALSNGNKTNSNITTLKGCRAHSLIILDKISPFSLGMLLAFYENVTMFKGFLWNINSFDQPGVEYGKTLAKELMNEESQSRTLDSEKKAYLSLLK